MNRLLHRKRLSMALAVLGVVLMGIDLMLTGSVFIHVGELMAASLACFILALLLDRTPRANPPETTDSKRRHRRPPRSAPPEK